MKRAVWSLLLLGALSAAFWAGSMFPRQEARVAAAPTPMTPDTGLVDEPDDDSDADGAVKISRAARRIIGLKVEPAEEKPLAQTIRVLGRVAADETRIYRINAAV